MCGIFFSNIDPKNSFNLIQYRGPDNTTITNIDNFFFGHHRLNIIEIDNDSSIGNQPILKDDIVLVCNGEIYNYKELSTNDTAIKSDCEVIIDCYINKCFNYLDGDFAFILYDRRHNKIVLGRDPVGLKPLFYYNKDGIFIACSELKVIEHMLVERIINFSENDIKHVPINSFIEISIDIIINDFTEKIFELSDTFKTSDNFKTSDINDIHNNIYTKLNNSIIKRLTHTNKPVGILCSGGIDSTIVTVLVDEFSNQEQKEHQVFTLKYNEGFSSDYNYVNMLRPNISLNITDVVLDLSNDSTDVLIKYIHEIIRILETYDPNTIRASIPMYYLASWISKNTDIKVILSGEGADELFMGYNYFSICESTDEQAQLESLRLLHNLYSFDILRAERCFSAHGLELRVPYLDKDLINYVINIPAEYKKTKNEKLLLRNSVKDIFMKKNISKNILERQKERFSDGISYSWVPKLLNAICEHCKQTFKTTDDKLNIEKNFYKQIYNSLYKTNAIIHRELPDWAGHNTNGANGANDSLLTGSESKSKESKINNEQLDKLMSSYNNTNYFEEHDLNCTDKIIDNRILIIDDLIEDLMQNMAESMLDRTKCSITAKNIFNYVVKHYSSKELGHLNKFIHWNDTLQNDYISLNEFINEHTLNKHTLNKHTLNKHTLKCANKMYYVYYDHICGQTSHYFILIFNNNGNQFYMMQSAVFEYSLSCWCFQLPLDEVDLVGQKPIYNNTFENGTLEYYQYLQNYNNKLKRYDTIQRIKNCPEHNTPRNLDDSFIGDLKRLEGVWSPNDGKPQIFEKLFACDMNASILEKVFKHENKKAIFKFRSVFLEDVV
jgi:asparagine synthase (glutamine-hydrolysing)